MQAYEFQTVVKNGTITLPFAYPPLHSQKVRIIVLVEENPTQNIQAILGLFAQAAQRNIFSGISDAVQWQKQLRDEWE